MKKLLISFLVIISFSLFHIVEAVANNYKLHVDRKERKLYLLDKENKVVFKSSCDVGKGGLVEKKSMSDYVTPTGEFIVDLILFNEPGFSKTSDENIQKYREDKLYAPLTKDASGLAGLFKNMSTIDFDSDGKSDQAYGVGYIGLESKKAVTGPKMRMYGKTPYWFSIALHGTPKRENIGEAASGGCVHVEEEVLTKLIRDGFIKIGTEVKIADTPPQAR